MLQTKSFAISDHEGINQLLTEFRLASGASIIVSDGKILIPYEDGAPMTKSQRKVHVESQINEAIEQISVFDHSIGVVKWMLEDINAKLKTAEADLSEATAAFKASPNSKKLESAKLQAEGYQSQLLEQVRNNNHAILENEYEVRRLNMNIDLFKKSIA
mgnify:CR=1 FL=1